MSAGEMVHKGRWVAAEPIHPLVMREPSDKVMDLVGSGLVGLPSCDCTKNTTVSFLGAMRELIHRWGAE